MKSRLSFLSTIFAILLMSGCTTEEVKNSVNEDVAKIKEATENTEESIAETTDKVESEINNAEDEVNELKTDSEETLENTEDTLVESAESLDEAITESAESTEDAVNEAEESFNTTDEATISQEVVTEEVETHTENPVPEKETVHFGFRSYTLDNTAGLDSIAHYLKNNEMSKATVSGYSDITGEPEFNIFLSQKRADFVKDYLVSLGVNESQVESKGFGATNFIADNDSAEGREQNRRVEVEIVSE